VEILGLNVPEVVHKNILKPQLRPTKLMPVKLESQINHKLTLEVVTSKMLSLLIWAKILQGDLLELNKRKILLTNLE
jgi:hypothetical protein